MRFCLCHFVGFKQTFISTNQNTFSGAHSGAFYGFIRPHVLVPPTPGPLAAAANLELENLFLLILFGGILALILVLAGAAYAHYLSKKTPFTIENIALEEETITALPSLGKAVAPILVPIVLMALGTAIPFLPFQQSESVLLPFLRLLCSPSFALGIGMLLAFRLLKNSSVSLNEVVEKGIQTAAPILIITAMGAPWASSYSNFP